MLIVKKRVLRRKRKVTSPYRVHCNKVTANDKLQLNIFDENNKNNPIFSFKFSGKRLRSHDSIHFNASEIDGEWRINFIEVQPD